MDEVQLVYLKYIYGLKNYLKTWSHDALESFVCWFCLDQISFSGLNVRIPFYKQAKQHTDAKDTCMTPGCVYILESAGEPLSKPPGTEKVTVNIQ